MFHAIQPVTDNYGNGMAGWQVEVIDYATGAVVPIFADYDGTIPIESVSLVANRAISDKWGNADFFVLSGTYNLKFYNAQGIYQRTVAALQMYGAENATRAEAARDIALAAQTGSQTAQTASEAARDVSTTQAGISTMQAGIATAQAVIATTQASNGATSAAQALQAATTAQGFANTLNTNATALPYEVTAITLGTAGSGATANGEFMLNVSGGPAGHMASVTVSGGAITGAKIINPGLATTNTAPTYTLPTIAGLTGATAPTATVGTIPVNRVFTAPTSDGTQLLAWINNAGSLSQFPTSGTQFAQLTKPGMDAAVAAVNALITTATGRPSYALVDGAGNLIAQISKEQIDHPDYNDTREKAASAYTTIISAALSTTTTGRTARADVDGAGNAVFRVSPEAMDHPVIDSLTDRVTANETRLGWDYSGGELVGELTHLIGYGQSLMEGDYATPVISTTARAYDKNFVGGRRPTDSGTAPTVYASLVAGVEVGGGRNSSGETPAAGAADMFAQLMLAENGIDLTAVNQQQFLGSNAARGGMSQAALASGTAYFDEWKDHITYGKAAADALGISYAVGAALHNQGEANYNSGNVKEQWMAGQRQMRLDMQAHAQAVCGNKRPLPMIMAQTMTHLAAGRSVPAIAMAQEELALEQWFATFPIHFMTYYAADNIHLTAQSQRWQGAYYGLYLKRWLVDKVKPTLSPSRVERSGSSVILTFPVATGRKLVLDSTMAALTTNYGFTIVDAYGTALTISRVALIGPNKIIITPTSGTIARVRNGWIGTAYKGISCVRDDSPLIFDPSGINKPMQLWAGIFERTVA